MPALWSILRHHDEIVDPDFLAWLKAQLDHLITLDPWTLVAILGGVVLAIPLVIVGFYLYQQRRASPPWKSERPRQPKCRGG